MEIRKFTAQLIKPEAVGACTYINVPFYTEVVFASRARIPVKGTVNGVPCLLSPKRICGMDHKR